MVCKFSDPKDNCPCLVEFENIRTGYQVAANLWGVNNQAHWARMQVMVVINTIIFTAMGWIIARDVYWTNPNNILYWKILLFISFVGLVITISWYLFMIKDAKDIDHYINCAERLEKYFGIYVRTIQSYNSESIMKTRYIIKLIILIFGLAYFIIFVAGLLKI